MSTAVLDQVLEQVKALTLEEQKRLRDLLDALIAGARPTVSEAEFEQRLLERGVISHIPPTITDLTLYRNRQLMRVQGKPLSETILEEGSYS